MAQTGFGFTSFQEIRSHSSLLHNLQVNSLLTELDKISVIFTKSFSGDDFISVFAILKSVYKNVRSVFFYCPPVRAYCNIDTKVEGVYTLDCMIGFLQEMVYKVRFGKFTYVDLKNCSVIMDDFELIVRRGLQYFQYFFRLDFKQKPDLDNIGVNYQSRINKMDVKQIRRWAGKDVVASFEGLGGEDVSGEGVGVGEVSKVSGEED